MRNKLLKMVENIDPDKYPMFHIRGTFRKRWYMRLICWFKKHQRKRVNSYGLVYLQCKRCGKEWFCKRGRSIVWKRYFAGEVGDLYKVSYSRSKKVSSFNEKT